MCVAALDVERSLMKSITRVAVKGDDSGEKEIKKKVGKHAEQKDKPV